MYLDQERPRKQRCQLELREQLHRKDYEHGTLVVLCGPNPKKAIKYHKNIYNKCILVENDADTFKKAKQIYQSMNKDKVTLEHGDVFDVIQERKNDITGIDFDFCSTLNNDLYIQIRKSIELLEQNNVWIRVTTSYRRMSKEELDTKKEILKQCIEEYYGYEIIGEISKGYNDMQGPMNSWQIQLEKK